MAMRVKIQPRLPFDFKATRDPESPRAVTSADATLGADPGESSVVVARLHVSETGGSGSSIRVYLTPQLPGEGDPEAGDASDGP